MTQIFFLLDLWEVIFLSNFFAIPKFTWLFQPPSSSASFPRILWMHMKGHSVPHFRIFCSLHTYSGALRKAPFIIGLLGCPLYTLQDIFVQHARRPLHLLKAPQLHVLIIQLYLPSQITQIVWDKLLMFETEPKAFFMYLHPYKTHSSIWGGGCWKDLLCLWVSFP